VCTTRHLVQSLGGVEIRKHLRCEVSESLLRPLALVSTLRSQPALAVLTVDVVRKWTLNNENAEWVTPQRSHTIGRSDRR